MPKSLNAYLEVEKAPTADPLWAHVTEYDSMSAERWVTIARAQLSICPDGRSEFSTPPSARVPNACEAPDCPEGRGSVSHPGPLTTGPNRGEDDGRRETAVGDTVGRDGNRAG